MAENIASVEPPSNPPSKVEGRLSLTSVTDLLQFLGSCAKSGDLKIVRTNDGTEARIYCQAGSLTYVCVGRKHGMDALVEVLGWDDGYFRFKPDTAPQTDNLGLPLQHALMEALRLRDEMIQARSTIRPTRSDSTKPTRSDLMEQRTSTDVLQDLLKTPGINAVVVVGRDGFLIESAGSAHAVDLDSIGAALAHAINGIEELGRDLSIDKFQDLFIEYRRAVILCKPAGDAIVALVSPDASKLGIIRHKTKALIEELGSFF